MVQPTMLSTFQARKAELEENLREFQDRLTSEELASRMRTTTERCILPQAEDIQNKGWYAPARERLQNLHTATTKVDITAALGNGRLVRPIDPNEDDLTLLTYIDNSHELAGLTKIITWLEEFKTCVKTRDANAIFNELVQLGVYPSAKCDCDTDIREHAHRSHALVWLHQHDDEYNRAVWEIVCSDADTIGLVRGAIQQDLSGPRKRYHARWYGQICAVSYAQTLLAHFVKAKPSATWVTASTQGVAMSAT